MPLAREIKVGAFVLAGLAATGGVIFLIGEERQLFSDKQHFEVTFKDVQGLRRGSPVRMGGVDIGTVDRVDYGAEPTTLVEFRLEPSAEGTLLRIVESGFERVPAHRRERAFRMNEGGWAAQADNIRKHVEGA